ncbi:hypothetical protein [Streptosporangium jomthongense]|uniref:Uncharacterized protein n=1 Tax=Streptosporangium jomthongense TaxID=1193683 RepID=A0ABV8F315_9ACTN
MSPLPSFGDQDYETQTVIGHSPSGFEGKKAAGALEQGLSKFEGAVLVGMGSRDDGVTQTDPQAGSAEVFNLATRLPRDLHFYHT